MITIDVVTNRLKSLGYTVSDDDTFALTFLISKVEQYVKHFCNIDEVPECLDYVVLDRCCGEFLRDKKATGQLTSIQLEQVVRSIKDGDTTVEFGTGNSSGDGRFDSLVKKLIDGNLDSLIHHRQLRW